jgi:soluble lytic murein transglycosylase-like protein
MYDTAIRYYKARGLTLTPESLADPVLNLAIGIEVLADKHEAAMIQGKTTKNDYMWALYYYCGKGDTYAREVMVRTVSYKRRLDAPLQDMLKKRLEEEAKADAVKVVAETKGSKKK